MSYYDEIDYYEAYSNSNLRNQKGNDMQTKIESFSDFKLNDKERGPSAKVKLSNGDQVYINEDPRNLVGKTVDIDVNEKTSQKGNRYKIGKILKIYEQSTATASAQSANSNGNSNGTGKITWDDYRKLAEAVHELALKLEPDDHQLHTNETGAHAGATIDRSPARVGFVNNVMRAYADGRFIVPKEDEDDIPPF